MLTVQALYVQALQEANAKGVIRDIVDALTSDQIITVSMMVERFGRTAPATSSAIQRLVELGILTGPFGSYARQYVASDILRAVMSPVGRVPSPSEPLLKDQDGTSQSDSSPYEQVDVQLDIPLND
jgi:hypothetical protein